MRLRDLLGSMAAIMMAVVWLRFCGTEEQRVRVYRIPSRQLETPVKMPVPMPAVCCSPACKSPQRCDPAACICVLPAARDAGSYFMQIYDPGPVNPGDVPSESVQ